MHADFTEHWLPSGAVVFYRDRDHSYFERIEPERKRKPEGQWKGCGKLTGVTTVVKPFDWEPGALMGWAVRLNIEGIAELVEQCYLDAGVDHCQTLGWEQVGDELEWLRSPAQIKERLSKASLTEEDAREEAADRGTNVHEGALNALADGSRMPELDGMTAEERGHALGVGKFWLDHDPQPLQSEAVVCDLGLGIAGRLDFRGYLSKCNDPKCACQIIDHNAPAIVDLKTGKHIMAPAQVQVAGYDHCSRVSGFGGSHWQFILQTFETGDYVLIRSHARREDFLSAIEIYRRQAEIMKHTRADARARES